MWCKSRIDGRIDYILSSVSKLVGSGPIQPGMSSGRKFGAMLHIMAAS